MWRVTGEKIDVTEISIESREKLFKNWYESKAEIECLCEKTNGKVRSLMTNKRFYKSYIKSL